MSVFGAGTIFHISKVKPVLSRKLASSKELKQTNEQVWLTFLAAPWGHFTHSYSQRDSQWHGSGYSFINTEYRVNTVTLQEASARRQGGQWDFATYTTGHQMWPAAFIRALQSWRSSRLFWALLLSERVTALGWWARLIRDINKGMEQAMARIQQEPHWDLFQPEQGFQWGLQPGGARPALLVCSYICGSCWYCQHSPKKAWSPTPAR